MEKEKRGKGNRSWTEEEEREEKRFVGKRIKEEKEKDKRGQKMEKESEENGQRNNLQMNYRKKTKVNCEAIEKNKRKVVRER